MAHIIVGTRGSQLALTQCTMLVEDMRTLNPEHTFELKIIKTTGDLNQVNSLSSFGTQGVFVKELENALLSGEIHCAVHSLKDVPHEIPEGLEVSIFSKREVPTDVLISNGILFSDLPSGAKIGTGSVRRRIMLQALRPDLEYVDIRGNIDTRIEKVLNGELEGVILAQAGMNRLSKSEHVSYAFTTQELIPSIGQGVLGIEIRRGDTQTAGIVGRVNDMATEKAMLIERGFMEKIGGGCKAPMAAYAEVSDDSITVLAMIANQSNGEIVRFECEYKTESAEAIITDMVTYFTQECGERGVPLPHELDDHQLLR